MKILSIETSCDETSAAIVEDGTKILSNIIASSADMHGKTGGVIPENAAREQIKSIIPVIEESFKSTHLTPTDLDAIAVTVGPGLIGSLLVGVETAKTLSHLWNKPLIPVNHLVAHLYANFLSYSSTDLPIFPLLGLVVSGGHTDLVLIESHGNIKHLGSTRDDAAGEAFDKCARLLGLPYPGGPNLSKAAASYMLHATDYKLNLFPRPMINEKNFDWSFSGLKTAVLREVQKDKEFDKEKLAAEVQEAIVDSLVEKCLRCIIELNAEGENIKSFLLSGGVAANTRLREKFQRRIFASLDSGKLKGLALYVPEIALCTDNAAPIASAAFFNNHPIPWQEITANPELTITDHA